jgi:hypothetical protein
MNIGLIDVDGHNFPNLALMKISSWHKMNGDNVEFATMFNHYDILYKSKVFTFTPDDEYCYNADEVIEGGTGYDYKVTLPIYIDTIVPDYSLYDCKHAYGFLTRGCIRKCSWCIVPLKEGKIRADSNIEEIIGNKKSAILMDNNVLAHEHGIRQIEKIAKLGIKVDFNQGLDARLIDDSIAKLLSKVKWLSPVRLACDSLPMIPIIDKAVKLLRKHNVKPSRYFCYILVVDEIDHALKRVEFLRSINVDPFAQAYRGFNNNISITKEQKDFCRWVNHKAIFKSVDYENYRGA